MSEVQQVGLQKLQAELKQAQDFGDDRHNRWRAAEGILYTMKYPEGDADLLEAIASEIDCNGSDCSHYSYENDTGAWNCTLQDRADDDVGCRFLAAERLRDVAKAFRAHVAAEAAAPDMHADLNAAPALSDFRKSWGFDQSGFIGAYETWQRNVQRTLAKVAGQEVTA